MNDLERRPKGGANGRQVTNEDRAIIHAHINTLDFELGFPCSHCKQKHYIRDTGKNWTDLYNEYVVYHNNNVVSLPSVANGEDNTSTAAASVTITTYDSVSNNDSSNVDTISSRRNKQRERGTPVSFDTWRQFLAVVYSHVTFQKYVIIFM